MALGKKSTSVVDGLHKGLGVRASGLSAELAGTELAERWGIAESDPLIVVRAKVIYRLERVFAALSPPDAEVWPVVYNTVRDLELFDRDLTARLAELPHRFPHLRVSSRSASRIIDRLRDQVLRHASGQPAEPFDPGLLAAIRCNEDEFARTVTQHRNQRAFGGLVANSYIAPIRQAQSAFLELHVVTSVSRSGQLVVARTPLGDWVCAFPDDDALHAYRSARPQQQPGAVLRLSGMDLARRVLASPHSIGVMFNPTATQSDDPHLALPLTPADLSKLADLSG